MPRPLFFDTQLVVSYAATHVSSIASDAADKEMAEALRAYRRFPWAITPITLGEAVVVLQEKYAADPDAVAQALLLIRRRFAPSRSLTRLWNRARRETAFMLAECIAQNFKETHDIRGSGLRDLLSIVYAASVPSARGFVTKDKRIIEERAVIVNIINEVRAGSGWGAFKIVPLGEKP